ncbi:hypothetical protein [Nocardia exalbida]|uniref:hypothetical protein n=1 Tax=Nocardia exalbida TaxID=290231 RepID=UPI0002DEDC21|nr:hypothetical protein [Nocardia exalbida]
MFVRLSSNTATVHQADDCHRLHVLTDLPDAELADALHVTGAGRMRADGDIDLDVGRLFRHAKAVATLADWSEQWERMIDYATARRWVSADGAFVRTHVEATR